MEGIQTINALKAVQSSLPAQTTIPSDELVMLYAADGTPIAKIARDDLVKAVASVMASNSQTTFSKLLGVQANGTPMGIGASDLASVLGGVQLSMKVGVNMDTVTQTSFCTIQEVEQSSPWYFLLTFGGLGTAIQFRTSMTDASITAFECRKLYDGTWTSWVNLLQ